MPILRMENIAETSLTLSSRKRRIAAFLIDHFILIIILILMVILFMDSEEFENHSPEKIQSTITSVFLPWLLFYFAKDSIRGMSLGRWIMGIMIRDSERIDEIPSFMRLFMRNTLLIIWPIEFIVLASNKEKKRLGDKLSRTTVFKNPEKQSVIPKALVIITSVIAFFSIAFFFVFSTIKQTNAYKTAINHIEKNEMLLKEIGDIKDYGTMPGGNISITNNRGEAHLQITVVGEEKEVEVTVSLTKEPGEEWKVIDLHY